MKQQHWPDNTMDSLLFYPMLVTMLLITAGLAVFSLNYRLWPQFAVCALLSVALLVPLVLRLAGRSPIVVVNRQPGPLATRILLGIYLALGLAILAFGLFLQVPIVIVLALVIVAAEIAFLVASFLRAR